MNLTIANHGLVSAIDMQLYFGTHPYYSITPLISDIGTLPGESSLTIPVILKRISTTDTGDAACSIPADLSWKIQVINTQINYDLPLAVINVQGDCPPGGSGVLPIGGGVGGGGTLVYEPIATTTLSDCNACETATNAALLQFSPFDDWEGLGTGLGSSLAGGATNVMADAGGFITGLVAYLQATPDIGEALEPHRYLAGRRPGLLELHRRRQHVQRHRGSRPARGVHQRIPVAGQRDPGHLRQLGLAQSLLRPRAHQVADRLRRGCRRRPGDHFVRGDLPGIDDPPRGGHGRRRPEFHRPLESDHQLQRVGGL